MDNNLRKFIFSTFYELFDFMNPKLTNFGSFSKSLTHIIKVKPNKNIQYEFDVVLNRMFIKKLEEFNITGKFFSEESGFVEFGELKYRVVFDPFCNSTLASHGFHEAAVGLSIFDDNYNILTSAIMDYHNGVVGMLENGKTNFYQIQNEEALNFNKRDEVALADAWVVYTLEKYKDRNNTKFDIKLFHTCHQLNISSGHIYWLRLAMGMIDAYLDPSGGEPLYEMFASSIAQGAGCVVTDFEGKEFNAGEYLKVFEKDPDYRYYPVAASSKKLHKEILTSLANSS